MPPCIEGQFSEEMVKQQIDVLLIAGHETTASTIAYVILMLAMHPNIQEQVFDELRSKYDSPDQETTYEKMQSLHLLDRVIKETTRLFPVVFGFSRTPAVDIPLKNCVIPKGVSIILPVYTAHRVNNIQKLGLLYLKTEFNSNFCFSQRARDETFGVIMLTNSILITFYRKMCKNVIHLHFYHFRLAHGIASVK